MTTLTLSSGWTLELARAGSGAPAALAERSLPATVPGCVHTDLLAQGVIADPLVGRNEDQVQWIGTSDWRYRCRFTAPPELLAHDRVDLHAEGLDTIATVELNGRVVGRAENMHRPHRFDVGAALRPGANELVVTFASALDYARAQAERLGERPRAYPLPFNFVRKMACNFGWDWGPTLVTAGIWKPISLEGWSGARMRGPRALARIVDPTEAPGAGPDAPVPGSVEALVEIERSGEPRPLQLSLHLTRPAAEGGDVHAVTAVGRDETDATLRLEVPSVQRWWPRGHGDARLYDLALRLERDDGALLDERSLRVGFRSVALDTRPDEAGAAFTLVVNQREIFAKGANWIPDDPFPSRVGRRRLRARLRQAADANMNLVRVWGGGVYESDDFYAICDELGLMVWQDFAFACAAYPEEEPFASEVLAEARANVVRLASHPSLVLWNGNNENLWGHEDWGWKAALGARTWGRSYYLDLLPRLLAELDPTRPYWPGSPWSGREDLPPNADGAGCKHIWDAWNEKDYTVYRTYRPRFVTEFGHQAPPTYATLERAISERPLTPAGPEMLHHQKAVGGNRKLEARLAEHFPVPRAFDAWHFATQLNQARALDLGIRHFRALAPHCMGTVVWQLNDCWPSTSWAAVDVDGRAKPLWFALRAAFAPRLLLLEPHRDGVTLGLHNDSDGAWEGEVRVRRLRFDGTELAAATVHLEAAARGPAHMVELAGALATPDRPTEELLVATSGELRAFAFFARDRDLRYPAAHLRTEAERHGETVLLRVEARTLVRDLTVLPDRLHPDATVDDALVTLLPGETHLFTLHVPLGVELPARMGPPVVTCANDVVRAPARAPEVQGPEPDPT